MGFLFNEDVFDCCEAEVIVSYDAGSGGGNESFIAEERNVPVRLVRRLIWATSTRLGVGFVK